MNQFTCVEYLHCLPRIALASCRYMQCVCFNVFQCCLIKLLLLLFAVVVVHIQLLRERLLEKMYTRQSQKVIWDMINSLFLTLQLSTYFCYFPLALENIHSWPLVPFSQISLKNGELKTAHNTFWDCCVHFFRQRFSKQLYTLLYIHHLEFR